MISMDSNKPVDYLYNLFIYDNEIPEGCILYSDLEKHCYDRLIVLKQVANIYEKNNKQPALFCKSLLIDKLNELKLENCVRIFGNSGFQLSHNDNQKFKCIDELSHFFLRLICTSNLQFWKWFVNQESKLFYWRVSQLSSIEIKNFIKYYNLPFKNVSNRKRDALKQYLYSDTITTENINQVDFYKVPFIMSADLMAQRIVFIRKGWSYVPQSEMALPIAEYFKRQLEAMYEDACLKFVNVSQDSRFIFIRKAVEKYIEFDKFVTKPIHCLTLDEIDEVSKVSFPLCMRLIHEHFREHHHIHHFSRVQYGLFLKQAGMDIDEAEKLWYNEFSQVCKKENWLKWYIYGIRHSYGKEGKCAKYNAYPCSKILNLGSSSDTCSGCPYKEKSSEYLEKKLKSYGMNVADIEDIVSLTKMRQYQEACTIHYNCTHKNQSNETISNPNIFYYSSRKEMHQDETSDQDLNSMEESN